MEFIEVYEVFCYVFVWSLFYNQFGICYILVVLFKEDFIVVVCIFSCMMKFIVKDCDFIIGEIDDEGYEDEYVLEDLEVIVVDYI